MLDQIKIIENFLSQEDYNTLYKYIDKNKKDVNKFRVFEISNKNRYESMIPDRFSIDTHNEIYKNIKDIYSKIILETKEFYNFNSDIYLHRVWLSVMGKNTRLDFHDDVIDGWINFTSVIYLNEDYDGGEIVFKDNNLIVKPKKNMLLIFDPSMVHGVNPITNGERMSISMWGTKDINGSRIKL